MKRTTHSAQITTYLLVIFLPTYLGSSESSNVNDVRASNDKLITKGSISSFTIPTITAVADSITAITGSGDSTLDEPYFDMSVSKNVTALVEKTAYLKCRVHNLGNKTVSWVRHKDIHLLTNGRNTYSSDLRFQSVHYPQTEDWILQIKYPQRRDSGIYECQISTTPPIGHAMYLTVVEPVTTVVGSPDLYINTGSTVNLTCIVRHLPEPPPSITWHHNNEEISYDSPRGGVSVITEKGDITISNLLIQRARSPDSGKYTCNPTNANEETVNVHILNGEHPEAMQHGGQLKLGDPTYILLFAAFSIIIGR